MCEENEHYIDVEWEEEVTEDKDHLGQWDIVASFSIGDEVILEQMMELDVAKIMIMDYYAPIYAHKSILSIRRRMRPFRTRHDRLTEKLEDKWQDITKGGTP